MFTLLVLLIFLVLPFYMGYRWANYAAFLVPVALLVLSVASYLSSQSSGGQPDETDVIPGVYLAASVVGLLLCAWGVALGKQRRDTSAPPRNE